MHAKLLAYVLLRGSYHVMGGEIDSQPADPTCFSGRSKGKFMANHPSTEKPRALEGFELGTEPELRTGDSHSTSVMEMET